MKQYSLETMHLFMSSISTLMVVIRGCSDDGKLKEPSCPSLVNQRFKGVINCVVDSLHNMHSMFDSSNDTSKQLSNIDYHIDMVTISKNGLSGFEEFNEDLNIEGFRFALQRIIEALNAMKGETLTIKNDQHE